MKFILIIVLVFILFGVLRRMMFNSATAAFNNIQKQNEKREQEERERKSKGIITITPSPHNSNVKGEIVDVDFEEIK